MRDNEFGPKKRRLPYNEYKKRELGEMQKRLLDSGLLNDRKPKGYGLFTRLCREILDLAHGGRWHRK